MLYLAVGYGLGLAGWPLMSPDPLTDSVILDSVAEVAVLLSLFAVGFKRGRPLSVKGWRLPARLAVVSMTITVALIARSAYSVSAFRSTVPCCSARYSRPRRPGTRLRYPDSRGE
jgi:NhaP-type Na+/H+ or K+/H+ antiporter